MAVRTVAPRRGAGALAIALRVESALLAVGLAALAVLAVLVLVTPRTFELPRLLEGEELGRFAAATAFYATGHVLRFLRLALLTYHPGLQLRRILQVHLFTTGLAVVLPFKLSELVRVRELGVVLGSFRSGLVVVWLERTFDAAVLAVLVGACAIALPGSLELFTPLLVVLCSFVAVTVVLLTVVPPNLRLAMLHLLRRSSGERGVASLAALRGILDLLRSAPELLRGRVPTLVLLSILVWAAEVAAVALALPGIGANASEVATALLSVLSSVSSGVIALVPDSADRLADALIRFDALAEVRAYRAVLTLPALVAGAIGGTFYLRWRGARQRRTAA